MINRVILIVMDSVGVGHLPDAGRFNDDRADTLLHISMMSAPIPCCIYTSKPADWTSPIFVL
jgi:phosphopentomutase